MKDTRIFPPKFLVERRNCVACCHRFLGERKRGEEPNQLTHEHGHFRTVFANVSWD